MRLSFKDTHCCVKAVYTRKAETTAVPTQVRPVQALVWPVVMYGCESRTIKAERWCFWTVVLEKTLESPLDCKEVQPVNLKGNQSWIFIGRTDAEAAILWPPDAKGWLTGKDPGAGKDWKKEKGMTEDEVAGWHHRLHGHEFEQTPGDSERQGSLACCSPWGRRVRHDWATELSD